MQPPNDSGTTSSSTTNVRLISEAPCEIMRILTSANSPNTRAANARSVAQILADQADDGLASFIFYIRQFGQVAASGGIDSFESTVSDTLTSEVETTSTATRCRSKAAKIALRNPCASCMRGAATSTMVMRFFTAMALKKFRQWGARAVISRSFARGIPRIQNDRPEYFSAPPAAP